MKKRFISIFLILLFFYPSYFILSTVLDNNSEGKISLLDIKSSKLSEYLESAEEIEGVWIISYSENEEELVVVIKSLKLEFIQGLIRTAISDKYKIDTLSKLTSNEVYTIAFTRK